MSDLQGSAPDLHKDNPTQECRPVVSCTTPSPRRVSHGTPLLHSSPTAGTELWGARQCKSHRSRAVGSQGQPHHWARLAGSQVWGICSLWDSAHSWNTVYFIFHSHVLKQKIMRSWSERNRTLVALLHSVISTAQHSTNGRNPSLVVMKSPSGSLLGLHTCLLDTRLSIQAEATLTSAPALLYS